MKELKPANKQHELYYRCFKILLYCSVSYSLGPPRNWVQPTELQGAMAFLERSAVLTHGTSEENREASYVSTMPWI